ncbi:MAG: glutamate--tRNA ligase, partial [Candidatus Bathyarchaeia archaeon]
MSFDTQLKKSIEKIALLNAHLHNGRARKAPVLGKLLSEQPHLKKKIKHVTPLVEEIILTINKLSPRAQRTRLEEAWPEALSHSKKKRGKEEKTLPPLENIDSFESVTTR